MLVFAADSGRVVRELVPARLVAGHSVGDDKVYLVTDLDPETGCSEFVAFDVPSGEPRWKRTFCGRILELRLTPGALWMRSSEGLHKLSTVDGLLEFMYGLPDVRAFEVRGDRVVLYDGVVGSVIALPSSPPRAPILRVHGTAIVDGQPLANVPVWVGSEVAQTSESGAFSAEVRAYGGVRVWIMGLGAPGACPETNAQLALGEPVRLVLHNHECVLQ